MVYQVRHETNLLKLFAHT